MQHEDVMRLRQLTEALPRFPDAVEAEPGFKEHKMKGGTSYSWNLYSVEEIACAKWFNSPGDFPWHAHDEREWLIVFRGSMMFQLEGEEERRLLPGTGITIEPGVRHRARFLEDCHYVAITVPRSPDWPGAKDGTDGK